MSTQTKPDEAAGRPLPEYSSILLAVDSSDHSNRGIEEAVDLARLWDARITGAHVYAAKLHDMRFRQMEGGLPEQFRAEDELERQRDVHDDLITRGLSIISDSYLDQVERRTDNSRLSFERRALEGKNYRELTREANTGGYDLLVMGALGLGRVDGSRLGTVCQRVARRSDIDSLIIKHPEHSIAEGPIVVAVDGSAKSYGGLLAGLSLARNWGVPLQVVSAFDPYYHYVAFNRIAGVLSAEAGKVFRFQEQEQLHEEIIDSGLAKIYQGHLSVAKSVAADYGVEVETVLLDGKPHDVILRYLNKLKPSLLIMGKTGIHADAELDIGGNTEHLLHDADCAVLISQREHQPDVDRLASVTTSWSAEAEARMERVPSFVRGMARMAILRYAQEQGHTIITESIVEEATAKLMPGHAEEAMAEIVAAHDAGELKKKTQAAFEPMRWSDAATARLLTVKDLSLRGSLNMRAEKKARADNSSIVEEAHIAAFLEAGDVPELHWQAAALARLMRVPQGFMRDQSKQRIEDYAREQGLAEISLATAEAGLAQSRSAMEQMQSSGDAEQQTKKSTCPFASMGQASEPAATPETLDDKPSWSKEAEGRLLSVPKGFCRDMTRKAAETIAGKNGLSEIDNAFVEQVMQTFQAGSQAVSEDLPWDPDARARIQRAPEMVQGMLVKEIEGHARRNGQDRVGHAEVDAVKAQWENREMFHLDPDDPRSGAQPDS